MNINLARCFFSENRKVFFVCFEENLFRKSGATSVSLGPTVLRAETAAIVSVALTQQ
jgi:hypothetical protein